MSGVTALASRTRACSSSAGAVLTIKLMPAQDFQVGSFKVDANGRVHGQAIVKVIDGFFENVGTANLLD